MTAMFNDAKQFKQTMCDWNLDDKDVTYMFNNSPCYPFECVNCP